MALDLEEQEQLAELKAWWKAARQPGRRGRARRGARRSPAGRAGAGTRRARRRRPRALYETLGKAAQAGDAKALRDAGGALVESYPRTLYASMGALVAARFYFDRNDLKSAKAQLQWVIERSPSDDFRDLARLRLAAVLLDEKALRRGAQAARGAARRRLRRAVRRAAAATCWWRRASRPRRSAAYKLALEKAGRSRTRVPRERAHAARGARRLSVARASLRSAALPRRARAAACSQLRRAEAAPSCPSSPNAAGGARAVVGRASAARDALHVLPGARRRRGLRRRARRHRGAPRCRAPARERWRARAERQLSGGVGADARTVVVATEEGEVIALDADERQGALARARLERGARAAGGRRRAWCWCAASTTASSPSAPTTASAAGCTSARRPR